VIDSSTLEQVDVSEFDVEMRVEPPHDYLNVNFTIQNRNQSLYFTMPPPNYSAKAYIYAKKNGYLDSTPLVIDSSFYWERMREPGLEYLTEHTFYLKPSGVDASSFNTNTGLIGTEGGTITTASGAVIVIPPGALAEETSISVNSHYSMASLPAPSPFAGGARFGPDGLVFNSPVTITVPLASAQGPGTELALFAYDEQRGGWLLTEFTVVVNPDGLSASGEVSVGSGKLLEGGVGISFNNLLDTNAAFELEGIQ